MKYLVTFFTLLLCAFTAQAQLDSLQQLPEVIVSDVKLRTHTAGISIQTITDNSIQKSRTSLTGLLQTNSLIYLRENGPGGVSSPSFRGTNAQQTAVVWNGINLNSQFTGQTDFNTISTKNYDNVSVRAGGGSVIYGSGAIGGSVHLENDISFGNEFTNKISTGYGSFNTQLISAKTNFSKTKWHFDAAVDYQNSDNDFEYLDTDQSNENGEFENVNFNVNVGYLLEASTKRTQLLKLYHNTYIGDRNFSGTLTAVSNDAYEDQNTRTLAVWERLGKRYDGTLRVAHIFEQFRFFDNTDNREFFSIGKSSRFLANYDATITIDSKKKLTLSGEYNTITADGSSIEDQSRTVGSLVALWKHTLTNRFSYELQARQETVSDFDSPFLLSVGADYSIPNSTNTFKNTFSLNASRNYRVPTFNDLFWQGPGATGNPDVLPETSLQAEVGHTFSTKGFTSNVRGYYIQTEDLIKWLPDNSGIWSPINIAETQHYGLEIGFNYDKQINEHHFTANAQYGYTIAEDEATGNQLTYVPKNKVIISLAHQYKWLHTFIENRFNGEVYTTTDNTAFVDNYIVSNIGVTANIILNKSNVMVITGRLNNVFNTNYQTIAFRPNPGRNFLIQTTFTF